MRLVEGLDALRELDLASTYGEHSPNSHSVVAVGVFDGVHLGHHRLLHQLLEMGSALQGMPTVVTFANHPDQVLRGDAPPPLCSVPHRLRLPHRRPQIGRRRREVRRVLSQGGELLGRGQQLRAIYGAEGVAGGNRARLVREMRRMRDLGVSVVRVLASSEGDATEAKVGQWELPAEVPPRFHTPTDAGCGGRALMHANANAKNFFHRFHLRAPPIHQQEAQTVQDQELKPILGDR